MIIKRVTLHLSVKIIIKKESTVSLSSVNVFSRFPPSFRHCLPIKEMKEHDAKKQQNTIAASDLGKSSVICRKTM